MKKRNKKYNPNRIKQMIYAKANQVHTLNMFYDNDVVEGITKEWLENNPREDVPTKLLYPHIKGDLIIAIKHRLISMVQKWKIRFVLDLSDGSEAEIELDLPEVSMSEIKNDKATFKIDRGHGVKTRWQGIDKEVHDLLEPLEGEGLECLKTMVYIGADAKFLSAADYSYFVQEKALRLNLGENVA